MYEPPVPPRTALLRAGDLVSLGHVARAVGLVEALGKPVKELPADGSDGRVDGYLGKLGGDAPTLAQLLGDGPLAVEARRLPAKDRKALVDRVRAYLLTAMESGIIATPAPPSAPSEDEAPTTNEKDLLAWAGRQGVLGVLRGDLADLAVLGEVPSGLVALAGGLRVESLGAALLVERQALPRHLAARAVQLGKEARAVLASELAHARGARRPLVPPPPRDPDLRGFGERLLSLRAPIAAANSHPRVGWSAELLLKAHPPTLVCHLFGGRDRRPVTQYLSLAGELAIQCDCWNGPASCRHALVAIDVTLELLADGKNAVLVSKLAALQRAPWERALAELERLAGEAPVNRTPMQTGWRLRKNKQGLKLSPFVIDAKRPRDVHPHELESEDWRPVDRAVNGLFDGYFSHHEDSSQLVSALELLAGDPRLIFSEGKTTRPATVTPGRVELVAVERDGGLQFSLSLTGRTLSAEDLAGLEQNPYDFGRVPRSGAVVIVASEVPAPAPVPVLIGRIEPRLLAVWRAVAKTTTMPAEAAARFGALAPRLVQAVPAHLPEAMLGKAIPAEPRAVLRLEALADDSLDIAALVRVVANAPAFPPGDGPRDVFLSREGELCHARRALEDEAGWMRGQLAGLGLGDVFAWRLTGDDALDLLARLDQPEVQTTLDIEWGKTARQVVTAGKLRIDVRERRDWFALSGGLEVGGEQVALAALLAALHSGRRYVQVGGDRWARLSDSLRARLAVVADLTASSGAALELPAMAAPLLEENLGDALIQPPLRWRELVARAQVAASAPPTPLPVLGLALRDYQQAGFDWLSRLASWGAGACLADDMGLGKTIQSLAVLAARRELGPALVVAPTSVGWNWLREAERCTPELRFCLFSQSERDAVISAAGAGDVIVVSYGLLVRHAEAFAARRFATLIFDEAHALKNPMTRRAQAAAALVADFKIALTGTPLENRLSELWSLFRIVVPGLLGGLDRFRERFAAPIERDRDAGRRAALARLVRPFLLRRLKQDVARELPPRTEVQVDVTLGKAERGVYDAIRVQAAQALAGETDGDKRFAVLAALTRLRQAACDAGLLDPSFTGLSSKLTRLVELVDELRAEGHRVLVFSQFTSLLTRARDAAAASGATCLYLDGSTPEVRRRELVDAFQAGEGDAFFISLKAGGAGLNLTGADNVIHLDPWWNPAVEDQATDRAHRIGQLRPVTVYRLVASGTVEDAILALHADKRALVAGVLEGSGAAGALDAQALAALLHPSREAAGDDEVEGNEPEHEPVLTPVAAVAPGKAKSGRRPPAVPSGLAARGETRSTRRR